MERVSLRKGNRLTTKCSTLTWNTTPCTNIRQGCRTSGISDILDCPQPQVKRSRRSCVFFVVSFDIVYLQTVLFRKSFTSLRRVERRKGSGRVSLLHGTLVAGGDHLSGVRHFRFNFIQLTITMNKLAFCHNVSKCIVEYCNCMQQSANNMKMILLSHLFSFLLPVFCRFFEADLALQEQSIPGAAPLSNLGETKMLTKHENAISGLSNAICQWRQKTLNTKNRGVLPSFWTQFQRTHSVFPVQLQFAGYKESTVNLCPTPCQTFSRVLGAERSSWIRKGRSWKTRNCRDELYFLCLPQLNELMNPPGFHQLPCVPQQSGTRTMSAKWFCYHT